MRQFLLGLVILACSSPVIAGCSKQPVESLNFAVGGAPHEFTYWTKLVRNFQAETGISVTMNRQPTDSNQRRQELLISLKARRPNPDVFLMDVAWVPQFAASNWLADLNSLTTREGFDKGIFFSPQGETISHLNGRLYALPVYVDGGLLYYRRDLLESYGYSHPPQTWEELTEMGMKIQAGERSKSSTFYGFVWQGAQYEGLICNFLEVAASNQGGLLFKNGKFSLDLEQNRQALSLMKKMIHDYGISPPNTFTEMKEENARRYFQNSNALFERNWPYAWALHRSPGSKVKEKFGIAPLPHFRGGQSAAALGGWYMGISEFSDMKAEAWQFMQFVLSYNAQKDLALNLGWNPGRKDVYEDEEVLQTLPHLKKLRDIFEQLVARPAVPYYSQISEILQQMLNAVLAGQISPAQGLKTAEERMNQIAARYRGSL